MKAPAGVLSCVLMASFSMAQEAPLADLQRKADQASGADCVHLSMHAARETLEDADRRFGTGDARGAHGEIDTTVRYATRGVSCSLEARKTEKTTEIEMRKLIRRMKDVAQTLDLEDRPHLQRCVAELEQQRDRLLHGIFGAAVGGAAEKKP